MNKINNLVKNSNGDFMYKKYTLFAVLCLFLLAVVLFDYYHDKTQNTTDEYYVLKSVDDVLTLYKGERFVRCYDVDTNVLPLTDQDNLKSGIILPDMAAVTQIIEDFDGNQ